MQQRRAWVAVACMLLSLISASSISHVASARQWAELFAAELAVSADAEPLAAAAPAAATGPVDDQAESSAMPPRAEMSPTAPLLERTSSAPIIKALPDFLPLKLPPFPWWALPIPSKSLPWSDPEAGVPHFPILDNFFLLLKIAESCFNCTYFLSVDTSLLLSPTGHPLDLSPANLRLLYYQVVPFRLPFAALSPLPLAFRIPSFLNGSYLLVTRSTSSFPRDNFVSLNYQRLLAPDLFVSDSMVVVHGISGFLAPFTLAIPFPSTT